jgi:hypothetical protein
LDLLQQVGVNDEGARAAVAQEVPRFISLEVPVDGAGVETAEAGHQRRDRERGLVPQHHRDHVAFRTAELDQTSDPALSRVENCVSWE